VALAHSDERERVSPGAGFIIVSIYAIDGKLGATFLCHRWHNSIVPGFAIDGKT
jgi:hypothetical protein